MPPSILPLVLSKEKITFSLKCMITSSLSQIKRNEDPDSYQKQRFLFIQPHCYVLYRGIMQFI